MDSREISVRYELDRGCSHPGGRRWHELKKNWFRLFSKKTSSLDMRNEKEGLQNASGWGGWVTDGTTS